MSQYIVIHYENQSPRGAHVNRQTFTRVNGTLDDALLFSGEHIGYTCGMFVEVSTEDIANARKRLDSEERTAKASRIRAQALDLLEQADRLESGSEV